MGSWEPVPQPCLVTHPPESMHSAPARMPHAVHHRSSHAACIPRHFPTLPWVQAVRQNRLAMLRDLAALPAGILDLAELPGF